MKQPRLKPCPFCGRPAKYWPALPDMKLSEICCTNRECRAGIMGYAGKRHQDKMRLISVWNRRVSTQFDMKS